MTRNVVIRGMTGGRMVGVVTRGFGGPSFLGGFSEFEFQLIDIEMDLQMYDIELVKTKSEEV